MAEQPHSTRFVRVVIDRSIRRELDYSVPPELTGSVGVGSRVRVPFRDKKLLGTVVATLDESAASGLRPIEALLGDKPVLSASLIELARWMSTYYCCPAGNRHAQPAAAGHPQGAGQLEETAVVTLLRAPTTEELEKLRQRAPRQAELLEAVTKLTVSTPAADLLRETSLDNSTLRALVKRGFVELREQAVARDPHGTEEFLADADLTMNQEQLTALQLIETALENPATHPPILLHGVTGSGKTEVYLQAIRATLARGKTAIVLVPENISHAADRRTFQSRFADQPEAVAVLHSHLSEGERHDEWHKLRAGRARIVIGARSAVFAPLENLGLIVVDEEHETSYKQEEAPPLPCARRRRGPGKLEGCVVLLGTATPSLESYSNATRGKYLLSQLTHRVDQCQMPLIRIVDLRLERRKEKAAAILSEKLRTAIEHRLTKNEQTILFLNRRGFSTSLLCSHCGKARDCPNCSVALTFHRTNARLSCHLCGHNAAVPKRCPECSQDALIYAGFGTEKLKRQ